MGIFDFLRGGKSKEEASAKYILKRQNKSTGGMAKVQEFVEEVSMDDLLPDLMPGTYALHKYQKGQSGFEQVWGPFKVTDNGNEEGESSTRRGKGSALEQFFTIAQGMTQLKEEATAQFNVMAPFFGFAGGGAGGPKTFIEQLTESKEQYDILKGFFGDHTSGEEPIKYTGDVPIWLHPKLIPGVVDGIFENIEKRLDRWGALPKSKEKEKEEAKAELPPYPKRPSRREKPEVEKELGEITEENPEEEPEVEENPEEPPEED